MLDGQILYDELINGLNALFEQNKENLTSEQVHNKYAEIINDYFNNNGEVIFGFNGVNPGGTPLVLTGLTGKLSLSFSSAPSPDVEVWKTLFLSTISISTAVIDTLGFNPDSVILSTSPSIGNFTWTTDPNSENNILDFCNYLVNYIKSLSGATITSVYTGYTGALTISNIL